MRPLRLFLLVACLAATAVQALDIPPPPAQWFTDSAHLVDPAAADALNAKLRAFEQQSGAQFIIYTFPSLEGESIEDFTIRSAERWKVGQKKYDNGLILFVFRDDRKMRFEVGYGLEGTMTDAISSRIIRDVIAPRFAQGDWAGGLNAGADAVIARITKGEAPVEPLQRPGSGQGQGQGSGASGIDPFFLIVIAVIFFVFILPVLRRGGRRGGCGGCIPLFFFPGGGGGITFGGGGFGGGFGGGGGGFSGGGGSFGGGGATGGW